MNDEDELKWQPSGGIRISVTLLRGLAWGALHEFVQTARRIVGHYDVEVYTRTPTYQPPVAGLRPLPVVEHTL